MPALLSSRRAEVKEEGGDAAMKKAGKKGVMGRIKSTFKLGRRKSSTSTSSMEAATTEQSAADTDKGSKARNPEMRTTTPSLGDMEDNEDEEQQQEQEQKQHQQREEEEEEEAEEKDVFQADDIKEFNGDEYDQQVPALDLTQAIEQDTHAEEKLHATTSPSPKKRVQEVKACDAQADEKEWEEEDEEEEQEADTQKEKNEDNAADEKDDNDEEEVLASDGLASLAPDVPESKNEEEEDVDNDEEEKVEVFAVDVDHGNQDAVRVMPPDPDLMIIGVSPHKVMRPSASARSYPHERDLDGSNNIDNDVPGHKDVDNDDSEDASATASVSRLAPRRSFPREQEQTLTVAVAVSEAASASSSTRKPDTPSAMPATRSNGARSGRRTTLEGIREHIQPNEEEEAEADEGESKPEEKLPPRPSSPVRVARDSSLGNPRRRSSGHSEAPILASSFGVAATAPEVAEEIEIHHDDGDENGTNANTNSNANAARRGSKRHGRDAHGKAESKDPSSPSSSSFASSPFDAGAAITQAFGDRVARLLGADPWGDRQDGLDSVVRAVKKTDLSTASVARRCELLSAALAAIHMGVEDRVAPVLYCALESLRAILRAVAPALDRAFAPSSPLNEQLSVLAQSIVSKLGDSNKRTQRESTQALLRLARLRKLRVLPHVLLHLSAKEVVPRVRVAMLHALVNELGVGEDSNNSSNGNSSSNSQSSGKPGVLNAEVVMQFAVPALQVVDDKTRKAAVELIAELHMRHPAAVAAQLTAVKPEMRRVVTRRVEELAALKQEQEQQQQQQQQQQNANQAEEAAGGALDDMPTMTLVDVPGDESPVVVVLLQEQTEAAQTVVGPVAWRKLESATWCDRREALIELERVVQEAKSDLRDVRPAFDSVVQHNFSAFCTVVHRWLADPIAPVGLATMDVFSTLIKVYGPCVEWRDPPVTTLTLLTITRLLRTMEKPSNRTTRAACRCLLKLTRLTTPHPLRLVMSCVLATDTDALVQMHVLRLLVPEFGFQPEGISAPHVLARVAVALVHANAKVRKTAADVALCTQRLMGKDFVLSHLQGVRAVTLKELEKNFSDEVPPRDSERPQTVHATSKTATTTNTAAPSLGNAALPPVQFGGENARRQLNSAPVGLGQLHCTPPSERNVVNANASDCSAFRRGVVLSNEEENFMDAILDGDGF